MSPRGGAAASERRSASARTRRGIKRRLPASPVRDHSGKVAMTLLRERNWSPRRCRGRTPGSSGLQRRFRPHRAGDRQPRERNPSVLIAWEARAPQPPPKLAPGAIAAYVRRFDVGGALAARLDWPAASLIGMSTVPRYETEGNEQDKPASHGRNATAAGISRPGVPRAQRRCSKRTLVRQANRIRRQRRNMRQRGMTGQFVGL